MTKRRLSAVALAAVLLAAPVSAWSVPSEMLDELYRPWVFQNPLLSPDGSLVAAIVADQGKTVVRVLDPASGAFSDTITLAPLAANAYAWVDGSMLAVVTPPAERPLIEQRARSTTTLIEVRRTAEGLQTRTHMITTPGWLVSSLPNEPDQMLYAVNGHRGHVYRLSASAFFEQDSDLPKKVDRKAIVASLPDVALHWLVDDSGEIRAALGVHAESVRLWHRAGSRSRFKKVLTWTVESEVDVLPIGVAEDGEDLLVLTQRGGERWGVYEFDPKSAEVGSLVYEHPSLDVVDAIRDGSGVIVGVTYVRSGELVYHYFDTATSAVQERFESHFPGKAMSLTSFSADRSSAIAWVRGPSDPGSFHLLDQASGTADELSPRAPGLAGVPLSEVRLLELTAKDGLRLEALFAAPRVGDGPPPLVVVPHGGPIGVMDLGEFSRDVQHLTLAGFAVLQVNYRGSGGKGRAFADAGRLEWGRGIEDDIDLAIDEVIDRGWVDGERMCIAGSSYGGYSALMTVIRHPDRFRCAATSAGVSDIGLMFTSSDFASTAKGRRDFAAIVGDPKSGYLDLKARSPVYLASQIETPVLILHGEADDRVTVEHARRLRKVLDLLEKDYEWEVFEKMGHGFRTLTEMRIHNERLERFLSDHLSHDDATE